MFTVIDETLCLEKVKLAYALKSYKILRRCYFFNAFPFFWFDFQCFACCTVCGLSAHIKQACFVMEDILWSEN